MSTSITALQAASSDLTTEVATLLADIVTALNEANAGQNPAVDAVTAKIQANVTALQAGDPVQPVTAPPA